MNEKISSVQIIQLFLLTCIAISTGAIALYLYRIPTGLEASENLKVMREAPAIYVRGRVGVGGSVSIDGNVDVTGSSVKIEDEQPEPLRRLAPY